MNAKMNPAHYGQDITDELSLSTDGSGLVIIVDTGEYRRGSVMLTKQEAINLMAAIKVWTEITFE